jgi:hypothetical protein
MNSEALLIDLRARGFRIEPRPNGNLYISPRDRLTPELVQCVREHKTRLLDLLRADHYEVANTEINYITRLNVERREADRQARRGYDFDQAAPSHAEFLLSTGHPAYSIIADCRRYGVALRIDRDGTLVVGKAGAKAEEPTQPWPALLVALEANLEKVAELVEAGWRLGAEFPQTEVT